MRFIIDKAHEFQIKDEVAFVDEPSGPGDFSEDMFATVSGDPTFVELKSTIEDLEPDQQVSLVSLMWIGRGDFDISEWDAAFDEAGDSWTTRTADYLIATPLVADYLEEGLAQLDYSCGEA